MNTKCIFKNNFAVIGKMGQGPATTGPEWIMPLWKEADAHLNEVIGAVKKDEAGKPLWWGAMNDTSESNKLWGDTGKYLAGCETECGAAAPGGWTKWLIPAQTYFVASATIEKIGETIGGVMGSGKINVIGSIHEFYPNPDNPSNLEIWFPIAEGVTLCRSCGMPMILPEEFGIEADGGANCVYCRNCYSGGALRAGVSYNDLSDDIKKLLAVNLEHPGIICEPLLSVANDWLTIGGDAEKTAALPALKDALTDGQDCDLTDTPWEAGWLEAGKICLCPACAAARRCVSDIVQMR